MVYFRPLDRKTLCTAAISLDTEADAVPICFGKPRINMGESLVIQIRYLLG